MISAATNPSKRAVSFSSLRQPHRRQIRPQSAPSKPTAPAIVDIGLFKRIAITERVRPRLEITSANFFNHPNYDNPATNIAAGGGVSSLDSSGARGFRIGIRLVF